MTREHAVRRPVTRPTPIVVRCGGCGVWRMRSRRVCRVCGWAAPK